MSSRPPDPAHDPPPEPATVPPLSTPATIAVTGITAALVLAVGVFVAERVSPPRATGPLPPLPRPTVVSLDESAPTRPSAAPIASVIAAPIASVIAAPIASVVAAPTASVIPSTSAAPIASVTAASIASASAAPVAATVPSASPVVAPIAAASLPADRGILIVAGPADTKVFINGALMGLPEEALVVPCRPLFVRLGALPEGARRPSWVGAGQSVIVRCRAETRATLGEPAKP